jgi:radical SAM superfamily enzyme YgiQ (UPF0313 family)
MRVLLINPNRYQLPPVPPVGLEHIAASLIRAGHDAEILDLCFSASPFEDIERATESFRPEAVGITVRNIDTVLYQDNEFFLDDIRRIVRHIKDSCDLPMIIGGAGVATNPEGVLAYLGADFAVAGPGEDAILDVLETVRDGPKPKVFRRRYRYEVSCPRRTSGVDYDLYVARGGIAGFETHKGCGSSCIYCIEANTRVSFKPVADVLGEIRGFVDAGITRFHLCDSEFNEDPDYCIDFCDALEKTGMKIDWALYMKPANYSKKLIRGMKRAGVSLITLTVDSWKKCPLYWEDIEKIIFSAKTSGIRVMVDFLAGFPYEDEETLKFYLDLFRRVQPHGVGINTFIRLYRSLPITKLVMSDEQLRARVIGDAGDGSLIHPVFFNQLSVERLRELIRDDTIFRIEGEDKGVNYTRAGSRSS